MKRSRSAAHSGHLADNSRTTQGITQGVGGVEIDRVNRWWAGGYMRLQLTRTRAVHTQEGGRRATGRQYKANAMKKPLIGTLVAATVVSMILAAPGGAAKPAYSVTCVVGTGGRTTVTWISGTSEARVTWRDANSTPVGEALVTVTTHGPDSTVLTTPATNAASANVTFSGKKPGFALGVCTSG